MRTKKYIKNKLKSRRNRKKKGTRQMKQRGGMKETKNDLPPPPKPDDM
jgi:hypothetical protein